MPWCEECAKYYTPNSIPADGRCPTCGDLIQAPEGSEPTDDERTDDEKAPWHFKLMVVMVAAYLGWRLIDLLA